MGYRHIARSLQPEVWLHGLLSPRASLLKAQPQACSPSAFSLNILWRFLIFFQGPIDYVAHILNVFLLWRFLRAIDPAGLLSDMLHFQCSQRPAHATTALCCCPGASRAGCGSQSDFDFTREVGGWQPAEPRAQEQCDLASSCWLLGRESFGS